MRSTNAGNPNTASRIAFSYSSEFPSTLTFKTENNYSGYQKHYHYVYVDGERIDNEYSTIVNSQNFRLPKGNHTIMVRDSLYDTSGNYYTSLYAVKVTEQKGATSEEINKAIVKAGSVPLTWISDSNYPWIIEDEKLQSNNYGFPNSASETSFNFNTTKPTEVRFSFQDNVVSSLYHYSQVYVDGNFSQIHNSSSAIASAVYRLPIGNHTIMIRDSIKESSAYSFITHLWDVSVIEIPDLEDVILSANSKPLTFENNDENSPWYVAGDAVRSSNYDKSNSSSSFKTTVTITETSKLSFDYRVGYSSNNDDHMLGFYVNEEQYLKSTSATSWKNTYYILEPGTYTFEWKYATTTTGSDYYGEVKNVSLTDNWTTVATTPGMLGVETLYEVDRLQDVEMLRVSGFFNSEDWNVIDRMTNLVALDISEVSITEIPEDQFKDATGLRYIKLPENLEIINDKAFYNCNLTSITIPASVKKIGTSAFEDNLLITVSFEEGSQLTEINGNAFSSNANLSYLRIPSSVNYIGERAFYGCSGLHEVILPEALTKINDYTFYDATRLEEVRFPENLTSIGKYAFFRANLKEIELPNNLTSIGQYAFYNNSLESIIIPEKVTFVGAYAFYNNNPLHTVELPSGLSNYDRTFSECINIKKIVCHAATPPVISGDPFNLSDKANITLEVPSFAVATYKLDSYWYRFGTIVGGAPTDYCKIIGDLKLLNNRRMEGKPDIDLYYGGKLTVGGDAPMEVGRLDIYTSEAEPSSLVSDCNAFTADEINTVFKVDANKWYFITPMVDIDLRQVNVSGTSNYVFRYYDGASRADVGVGNSWKNVNDMTLRAGIGYIFQCDAAGEITFPVASGERAKMLSTEPVRLALTAYPSEYNAHKGWNYLGNPYPSYYDIYYMDFTAPITVWTGSTYRAYSITDDNFVLRPMQGFFVQKPDAIDAITLPVAGRTVDSAGNRPLALNGKSKIKQDNSRSIFNLEIGEEESEDMTRIVLNEKADSGYEIDRDASKFMSMDETVAQIFTIDEADNQLAINERPLNDGIVNLGLYIPDSNQEYTIKASRMDGEAILIDKENDLEHNLLNGGYKFSTMNAGICEGRFALRLKANIPSGLNEVNSGGVEIETLADGIIVKGAKSVMVYSMDGIRRFNNANINGDLNIELPQGIYTVVANGKSYKVIVK